MHQIFNEFDKLFIAFSEKQLSQKGLVSPVYDSCFTPLYSIFREYGWQGELKFKDKHFQPMHKITRGKKKTIIVCFSGGKDSTATALYYKDRGFNVILYHLHGINKMYKDEYLSAQKVAETLNLPLIMEDIKEIGWVSPRYGGWVEHPMKNMMIANRAIQYGLENRLNFDIAFGNFSSSTIEVDDFEICGGDCKELWGIYNGIMQTVIPKFTVKTPLKDMQDTWRIFFDHMEVVDAVQSCIIPFHYKQRLRKRNELKYGFIVPPNRCGSCWKCAVEYITYVDNDVWEYNKTWYKHSLEVLVNAVNKEYGVRLHKLEDVWGYYLFHDIAKSKYFSCNSTQNIV